MLRMESVCVQSDFNEHDNSLALRDREERQEHSWRDGRERREEEIIVIL